MPNLGGLGFSHIVVLVSGFGNDDWPARFRTIPATKSFGEWGEDKGVLIVSSYQFKRLEADAIATIETPVREDTRERAKHS